MDLVWKMEPMDLPTNPYGGFPSHGCTPKLSNLDHDLGLKPMVTSMGSPILRNPHWMRI